MSAVAEPLSQVDAVATIAAMVTPALLILGSASLVASALVRMARVVDRARTLAGAVHEGNWQRFGATRAELHIWLERHAIRARHAERSIALLYLAIVVFIATCLSIPIDRATGHALSWLPLVLALAGTLLLLAGGGWMVAESRLSRAQIGAEIDLALAHLDGEAP